MKYWFRKRRGLFSRDLGWGFVPISKEGWMMVGALIVLMFGGTNYIMNKFNEKISGFILIGYVLVVIVIFSVIAANKSEEK